MTLSHHWHPPSLSASLEEEGKRTPVKSERIRVFLEVLQEAHP